MSTLAAVLAVAAVLAGFRLASFLVSARARSLDDLERAAQLDPGDVALRLSAAEHWISAGHCDRARPHLEAVKRFSPASPFGVELGTRCRAGP